jgi:hypothetical protein
MVRACCKVETLTTLSSLSFTMGGSSVSTKATVDALPGVSIFICVPTTMAFCSNTGIHG